MDRSSCRECGAELGAGATRCGACGVKTRDESRRAGAVIWGIVAVLVVAWGGLAAFAPDGGGAPGPRAMPTRDRCQEAATAQLVNRLAPRVPGEILGDLNFSKDVEPTIVRCQYYPREDTLLLTLAVGWHGMITETYYQANGHLTIRGDGWEWETTGGNDALIGLGLTWGIIQGAVAEGSRQTDADGYWLVCVTNRTDGKVHFSYRWADADSWVRDDLEPSQRMRFSNTGLKVLRVRFDHDAADGSQETTYKLEAKHGATQSCEAARAYEFRWDGGDLKMYFG